MKPVLKQNLSAPAIHPLLNASRCQIQDIPGIQWNLTGQLELLTQLADYYPLLPFPTEPDPSRGYPYYYNNPMFAYGDAIMLFCILHHFQPQQVLEMGAGYSSAIIIEVNQSSFQGKIRHLAVDPQAKRLMSLHPNLPSSCEFREGIAQHIPLETFAALKANDILFIDSSHMAYTGSDVEYLLMEVLPALAPGVVIHFHDIFLFEYPQSWLDREEIRASWNEAYLLKAFLQFNHSFEIILSNQLLIQGFPQFFKEQMPLCRRNPGGSIWLRRKDNPVH